MKTSTMIASVLLLSASMLPPPIVAWPIVARPMANPLLAGAPIANALLAGASVAHARMTDGGASRPSAEVGGCHQEAQHVLWGEVGTRAAPSWIEPGMPPEVWRLVEASSEADAAGDEDLSKCLLEAAEEQARSVLEVASDTVSARFALAVVLGLRADRNGGRTKVRAASALHVELRQVLDAAPDHARARHILGRLHAGVMRMDRITRWVATNLLGGGPLKEATWERAEENLAYAEARAPGVAEHHYELARLLQDTDRDSLALVEVRHVLELGAASAMEAAVRLKAIELMEELMEELEEGRKEGRKEELEKELEKELEEVTR